MPFRIRFDMDPFVAGTGSFLTGRGLARQQMAPLEFQAANIERTRNQNTVNQAFGAVGDIGAAYFKGQTIKALSDADQADRIALVQERGNQARLTDFSRQYPGMTPRDMQLLGAKTLKEQGFTDERTQIAADDAGQDVETLYLTTGIQKYNTKLREAANLAQQEQAAARAKGKMQGEAEGARQFGPEIARHKGDVKAAEFGAQYLSQSAGKEIQADNALIAQLKQTKDITPSVKKQLQQDEAAYNRAINDPFRDGDAKLQIERGYKRHTQELLSGLDDKLPPIKNLHDALMEPVGSGRGVARVGRDFLGYDVAKGKFYTAHKGDELWTARPDAPGWLFSSSGKAVDTNPKSSSNIPPIQPGGPVYGAHLFGGDFGKYQKSQMDTYKLAREQMIEERTSAESDAPADPPTAAEIQQRMYEILDATSGGSFPREFIPKAAEPTSQPAFPTSQPTTRPATEPGKSPTLPTPVEQDEGDKQTNTRRTIDFLKSTDTISHVKAALKMAPGKRTVQQEQAAELPTRWMFYLKDMQREFPHPPMPPEDRELMNALIEAIRQTQPDLLKRPEQKD